MNDAQKPDEDPLVKSVMGQVNEQHPGGEVLQELIGRLTSQWEEYKMKQHPERWVMQTELREVYGSAPEHIGLEAFRKHNAGRNRVNSTNNYLPIP